LEIALRHAVANMVAAVLACPPQSNHLWYHLFAANELNDTYMTGFMVNKSLFLILMRILRIHSSQAGVSPSRMQFEEKIMKQRLYDCGVELSPDGTYGRPDYLLHATRNQNASLDPRSD